MEMICRFMIQVTSEVGTSVWRRTCVNIGLVDLVL